MPGAQATARQGWRDRSGRCKPGFLRPGGVLVAVCLNGPRQQEKLLPFSDVREELPRGTFAYTDVPTMIIRLRA